MLISVLTFPAWMLAVVLFGTFYVWVVASFAVARFVHRVINILTGGSFAKNLEEFMVPSKNKPVGLAKFFAKTLLHEEENYTYLAPVLWNSFGYSFMWIVILFLRYFNIGGYLLLILIHMYVMGACSLIGGNEIHYVAHLQVSTRQEAHLFKYEILNYFVSYFLEPAMGWIPGFWLDHHVAIHHKQSNGVDDIQSVSFFERSPFNFFWFVVEMPIQWYIRGPYHHFRNGQTIVALRMIIAQLLYFALGFRLFAWDKLTGLLLFFLPHGTRIVLFNSVNEYTQHALVDNRDGKPENPANNSFLLLRDSPTNVFPIGLTRKSSNWEDQWHAVHHIYPRKHMSKLEADREKIQCHLIFDMCYYQYKRAIVMKDVKSLAAAWRPGYKFNSSSTSNANIDEKSKADAALSLEEKEKVIESFFKPAFSIYDCGPVLKNIPWPFIAMKQSHSVRT